jgi:Hemerythrin HHE cation binding domain
VDYKLDMSVMLAIHDALRRDLARVAKIAAAAGDDPARMLRAALGWELFKKFLVVHHQAEDDVLWPALREAVAAHPDQVALADALEQEHAVIEPLLAAIDAVPISTVPVSTGHGHERFADIVDELVSKLTAHLAHEEADGLALIDASLTPRQWQHFAAVHGQRLTPDAALYMPWLLSDTPPGSLEPVLAKFPPKFATAFREQWAPAYAALDAWKGW